MKVNQKRIEPGHIGMTLVGTMLGVLVIGMNLGGSISCSSCAPEDDEMLIRRLVADAVARAEKHDVAGLFELAAQEFIANPGSHDRRSSKAMLMVLFRRYGSFHISHPVYSVTLASSGTEADVTIPFLLIRDGQVVPHFSDLPEDPERWLEEAGKAADPFLMNAHLLKDNGEWKVATVRVTGRRSVGW